MKENYCFDNLYEQGEEYKYMFQDIGRKVQKNGLPGLLGLMTKIIEFGNGTDEGINAVCHISHYWNLDGGLAYSPEFIEHLINMFEGDDPDIHLWQRDDSGKLRLIQKTSCELSSLDWVAGSSMTQVGSVQRSAAQNNGG